MGSHNPDLTNQIVLHTDYVEFSTDNGITWNQAEPGSEFYSDAETATITRSKDGRHLFFDYYGNIGVPAEGRHGEGSASYVFAVPL